MVTWRARCSVMGTPGSGNGLGKRAGRNPGTAPQADFTLDLAVRRLPGPGRRVPGAAVGASEGPPPGSEAGPDRAGGQRGWPDPRVPPRLPRRRPGGGPCDLCDDPAEADPPAAHA